MAEKKYLQLKPEDQAKVDLARELHEARSTKISQEFMLVAEFGYYFGFEAIKALLEDYIELEQAQKLIEGARVLEATRTYDMARAGIASRANKSKQFQQVMKVYEDRMSRVE